MWILLLPREGCRNETKTLRARYAIYARGVTQGGAPRVLQSVEKERSRREPVTQSCSPVSDWLEVLSYKERDDALAHAYLASFTIESPS